MISRRSTTRIQQPRPFTDRIKREDAFKKKPSAGKENVNPSAKLKRSLSTDQAQRVIQDVKVNAAKTFSSVKSSIDNLSQKLRRSSRKRCSPSLALRYEELNEPVTPVKLYSPFEIVTPSPHRNRAGAVTGARGRRCLSGRRFAFVSPTGKLKKDIDDLSAGMKELQTVAKSLRERHASSADEV